MSILNSYFLSSLALIPCALLTYAFGFTALMLTADIIVGVAFVATLSSVITTMAISTHLQVKHANQLISEAK